MSLPHPLSAVTLYRKCCIKPFKEKALEHVHGYIYYYSMIYILPCTHFEFSRLLSNEAANCDFTCSLSRANFSLFLELYRRGASIVVDTFRVADVYSQLLFNPLCFLLYENTSQSPEHWENVRKSNHVINVTYAKTYIWRRK